MPLDPLPVWGGDGCPVRGAGRGFNGPGDASRVAIAESYREDVPLRSIALRTTDASPLRALVFLVECVDVREVTTELPVIESVAEDELVGNGKADVVEIEVDFGGVGFMEERDAGERCRVLVPHSLEHVFHRQARVDDVFHDDHMAAFDAGVDFLELSHLAAGDFGGAVGGELEEVDLAIDIDVAHEVGHEDERTVEHTDEDGLLAVIVGGDLLPELGDALLDGGRVEVDLEAFLAAVDDVVRDIVWNGLGP